MALFQSRFLQANEWLFADANCTIIYSLKPAADLYLNKEIKTLDRLIQRRKVVFIDLNLWRDTAPHKEISGRQRHQIRSLFNLPKNSNQALIFNQKGQLIGRHSGSVTLVNMLIDCQP
ncbi:hypothetical protein L0668_13055 [Paraglaciecola aquimarina]|uniref:Thioredoxin-like fold domain-containing protein n=1 Tax=Paraglaciecola algarum TaxID=3050085 RepID=A0ABS9DAJ8_9ALTE|nr:hypothetical protein [Paraglaciecola sp. G1-23]MCF2949043.1 hypothetical protein [Paraglaciecola sp. G1-23]